MCGAGPPIPTSTEATVSNAQASTTIIPDSSSTEDEAFSEISSQASISISPAALNYPFYHGRRYHAFREGRYVFPNDEQEQNREDLKHAMIINLCGGRLHFAPIGEHPQRVLDLGTGTGIWCIDSAFSLISFLKFKVL